MLLAAGCGSPSTPSAGAAASGGATPSSIGGSPVAKASPLTATAGPLTDDQRVEEQAFDLWLAGFNQALTVVYPTQTCEKEGAEYNFLTTEWCAQWTFQISDTGKASGQPLSGAVMATASVPAEQRYVMASWSCSATDYAVTKHTLSSLPLSRLGADSSAGTIERRQIAISLAPQVVSDADRANGITWQGHVRLTFIQRFSYSAEDFGNVGNITSGGSPQPGYWAGQSFALLTVGQWTSYSDVQSDADLALQNGKLAASGPGGLGFIDSSNGQLSQYGPGRDCTF